MNLFKDATEKLPIEKHPLLKAMLEEMCEHVENSKDKIPEDQQVFCVYKSFATCLILLQSMIKSLLQTSNSVTFNYRNVTHVFHKDDPILKMEIPN